MTATISLYDRTIRDFDSPSITVTSSLAVTIRWRYRQLRRAGLSAHYARIVVTDLVRDAVIYGGTYTGVRLTVTSTPGAVGTR